jgi:hypothetical protein
VATEAQRSKEVGYPRQLITAIKGCAVLEAAEQKLTSSLEVGAAIAQPIPPRIDLHLVGVQEL